MNHADKTARSYSRFIPYSRILSPSTIPSVVENVLKSSPLGLITSTTCIPEIIDLFHDCIGFDDSNIDPWSLLTIMSYGDLADQSRLPCTPFLISKYYKEMMENTNEERLRDAMSHSIRHPDQTSFKMLLNLDEHGGIPG